VNFIIESFTIVNSEYIDQKHLVTLLILAHRPTSH